MRICDIVRFDQSTYFQVPIRVSVVIGVIGVFGCEVDSDRPLTIVTQFLTDDAG